MIMMIYCLFAYPRFVAIPGPYTWLFLERYMNDNWHYDITIFDNRRTSCCGPSAWQQSISFIPVCLPLIRYSIQHLHTLWCITIHKQSHCFDANTSPVRAFLGSGWGFTPGECALVCRLQVVHRHSYPNTLSNPHGLCKKVEGEIIAGTYWGVISRIRATTARVCLRSHSLYPCQIGSSSHAGLGETQPIWWLGKHQTQTSQPPLSLPPPHSIFFIVNRPGDLGDLGDKSKKNH